MSGGSSFGPPSTGYQQQQQQKQKPANGLSGASTPVVLASAQMTATSAATDLHAHHHSQGQGGVSDPAKEEESKINFLKDEVRSVGGTTEGSTSGLQETPTFLMPLLKIEDKAWRGGRQREDGHGAGGASLGSAGQSPNSPLSTHSSPSASLERSSLNSSPDQKSHSDLDFTQHNMQNINLDTKVGVQMSSVVTRTGDSNTSLTGTDRPSSRNGGKVLKGFSGPAADLSTSRGSGMEPESFKAGSGTSTSRGASDVAPTSEPNQDLGGAEDQTSVNTKKNMSQSSELPQRTTVRRTMSECSHLAVPSLVAGAYPAGVGGSPRMPHLPDFALVGAMGPPRAPYPHAAVRRSLTVTDGSGAAAAVLVTARPSSLMTSPLLPSSPPPKRLPGSCETNFLLPVPPHARTSSSQETENGKL